MTMPKDLGLLLYEAMQLQELDLSDPPAHDSTVLPAVESVSISPLPLPSAASKAAACFRLPDELMHIIIETVAESGDQPLLALMLSCRTWYDLVVGYTGYWQRQARAIDAVFATRRLAKEKEDASTPRYLRSYSKTPERDGTFDLVPDTVPPIFWLRTCMRLKSLCCFACGDVTSDNIGPRPFRTSTRVCEACKIYEAHALDKFNLRLEDIPHLKRLNVPPIHRYSTAPNWEQIAKLNTTESIEPLMLASARKRRRRHAEVSAVYRSLDPVDQAHFGRALEHASQKSFGIVLKLHQIYVAYDAPTQAALLGVGEMAHSLDVAWEKALERSKAQTAQRAQAALSQSSIALPWLQKAVDFAGL